MRKMLFTTLSLLVAVLAKAQTYTALYDQSSFNSKSIDLSLPVGAVDGAHAVSPSGAATYTIPIKVPPGTAGIEPQISINYNSQSGNGLVGYSWNIGGL